ncbi:hypothetical protein L7F22_011488 [Adiantum nelumboides]|nr:hypothetical protein [Adiantum nelumboides]
MTLLAMARRKCLVNDEVLVSLLHESWEVLDISGSEVTDHGLKTASNTCSLLKAVDISGCNNISSSSIHALVQSCPLLEILRCGGTTRSNAAAKQSIHFIVPRLNFEGEAEECWETLESKQVGRGASSLKWLVWPAIDPVSLKQLTIECPKIVLNPTASSHRAWKVPCEALPDAALDNFAVSGIDPKSWSVNRSREEGSRPSPLCTSSSPLSIAERLKLAFAERDERLAPKRAKNFRQNQRRAEKAWIDSDVNAKAVFWAGVAQKSMKK